MKTEIILAIIASNAIGGILGTALGILLYNLRNKKNK